MGLDLTAFEALSPEELREAAKQLQNMAYRKEGGNRDLSKERLSKLLDVESEDFMGTGMTLHDFMLCGRLDELSHSFATQDKDERRRRLGFIIRLGAELDKIKQKGPFATGLAEAGIESVILGDWSMVREWADHFEFKDEHESIREAYATLYVAFVGLLREAFDTRPEAEPAPKGPTH